MLWMEESKQRRRSESGGLMTRIGDGGAEGTKGRGLRLESVKKATIKEEKLKSRERAV